MTKRRAMIVLASLVLLASMLACNVTNAQTRRLLDLPATPEPVPTHMQFQ